MAHATANAPPEGSPAGLFPHWQLKVFLSIERGSGAGDLFHCALGSDVVTKTSYTSKHTKYKCRKATRYILAESMTCVPEPINEMQGGATEPLIRA